MSDVLESQVGGDHYKTLAIQPAVTLKPTATFPIFSTLQKLHFLQSAGKIRN